jgi:hypothetical protein
MKLCTLTDHQAETIVRAMCAVVSAESRIPLLSVEEESIAAIQKHLLRCIPLAIRPEKLPADIADVVSDAEMRLMVVRILVMLPLLDQRVQPEKAQIAQRVAAMLAVHDSGLIILRQAVARQYRRITLGILHRSIRQFWSDDGTARWRDWIDMVFVMMPMLTQSRRALRERYRALGSKPHGTLGRVLFDFYRGNGFAMPGEPRSFPEKFVLHEIYHIFGSYPVTHQGEMLTGAFTGGNVERLCMDMILLSLLQYQVGASVAGVARGIAGQLNPDEFFHAIARGAAMSVNLMEGWDFWAVADRPLQALRQEYGLPPLSGHESFEPLPVSQVAA